MRREEVLGDFRVKDAHPLQLENRFSFAGTTVLMSQEEFDSDGAGYYVLLEKLNDGWMVGETTLAWVF
jgi:hypothetical protein